MRQIYLIRHCQPDFPEGQRMCLGTTDIPLSDEGFAQAKAMALSLPAVTAVFSSPLSRAVQTAEEIDRSIIILPGLREGHTGLWDGLTFREIRESYPELYEARGENPRIPIPGAEDAVQALIRFRSAVLEAVAKSQGDIAVVSHGGVIASFLESLGGNWEKPGYGQWITLTYDGEFCIQKK